MKLLRSLLVAAALCAATLSAQASQDPPKPAAAQDMSGIHDFDFLAGSWRVHHRRLKARLAGSHEWIEFDGTCVMRPLLDGLGNVDDNFLDMPGGAYRGVGLRSYDPKDGKWTIWWLDSRNPSAPLDPPVRGSFKNGVGEFFSDDTLDGKPIRVRYIWSQIAPKSAHWEQAFSPDGGKTWETNWTMEFRRE